MCYHGAKVLGRVDVGERWCRGGSAAARRSSELSGVAESGGWPCSASLVVRPGVNDARLLCKARGQVREGRHADGAGFGELTVLGRRSTARTMMG